MITMRDRVRRPIQANLKRFIFVVVVFSLALCLLGQIALSFYCFYDSHRGVMGDEVSVFLDSSLTDAQRKKAQEQIRALAPITEFREIKPTDVLEKDILKLVGDRKKIPTMLALQFPSDTRYIDIEGAVKSIEKVKGVEGVTANLDWIKKRRVRGAGGNVSLSADISKLTQTFGIPARRERTASDAGCKRLGCAGSADDCGGAKFRARLHYRRRSASGDDTCLRAAARGGL